MAYRYQVWIIPNGQITASLAKTEAVPGLPGISGMFRTKLRNIAGQNQTHNASAGWMDESEVAFLLANLDNLFMVYEPAAGQQPEHPLVTIARLGFAMWIDPAAT
jgi:hypothetical protein